VSLDVSLVLETVPCPCCGAGADRAEVFSANITHNLTHMADKAGLLEVVWEPASLGYTRAAQLIAGLESGLQRLKSDRRYFEQFNAPNGWGLYEHLVPWLEKYLEACRAHPTARVETNG